MNKTKLCVSLLSWGMAMMASAQTFTVKVSNPTTLSRTDVPVVVDLKKTLGKKVLTLLSAEVYAPHSTERSLPVPSQLDDLDGDLIPDELAFVADMPSHSSLTFTVKCSAAPSQRQ